MSTIVVETHLSLRGLVRSFGGTTALDGLTLDVRRGEVLGLLGPNGAGKSTLLNVVLGQLQPDAGRVLYSGRPWSRRALSQVGFAPQDLALYDDLSGEENLRFFARMHGLKGKRLRERVADGLAFVGLSERRHERVGGWSGGMKRRLNLAAAIVHEPDLLLLDEPTAGVDPQSRNLILENVSALRERGVTVIYTTHYMEEVERLADRVAIVDRGRVLALGTVSQLLARFGGNHVLRATVRGEERALEADDPVQALAFLRRSGPISAFRLEGPNLEQVFLRLTGRTLRD